MAKRRKRHRSPPAGSVPASQPAPGPGWRQAGPPLALASFVLLAAALALYGGALRHPLVFDDVQNLNEYALKAHYADAASRFGLRWLSDASFWWVRKLC